MKKLKNTASDEAEKRRRDAMKWMALCVLYAVGVFVGVGVAGRYADGIGFTPGFSIGIGVALLRAALTLGAGVLSACLCAIWLPGILLALFVSVARGALAFMSIWALVSLMSGFEGALLILLVALGEVLATLPLFSMFVRAMGLWSYRAFECGADVAEPGALMPSAGECGLFTLSLIVNGVVVPWVYAQIQLTI
ncbi:MAG: hypothetical protein Q4B99_01565 [Clostridia bacterium]|nr:hypothetical protein [Clostridia bacterium]